MEPRGEAGGATPSPRRNGPVQGSLRRAVVGHKDVACEPGRRLPFVHPECRGRWRLPSPQKRFIRRNSEDSGAELSMRTSRAPKCFAEHLPAKVTTDLEGSPGRNCQKLHRILHHRKLASDATSARVYRLRKLTRIPSGHDGGEAAQSETIRNLELARRDVIEALGGVIGGDAQDRSQESWCSPSCDDCSALPHRRPEDCRPPLPHRLRRGKSREPIKLQDGTAVYNATAPSHFPDHDMGGTLEEVCSQVPQLGEPREDLRIRDSGPRAPSPALCFAAEEEVTHDGRKWSRSRSLPGL
jgi:hypothetical protein